MIIIGERINSTRKPIYEAIKAKNSAFILKEVRNQLSSGAHFIDINCAMTAGDEMQDIDWLVSVIQSEMKELSLCIDSPNYLAITRALSVYKGKGNLIINSITADEHRIRHIVPLATKHRARVIALTMDEKGMPNTKEERLEIAKKILKMTEPMGLKPDDIYFDPLIRPVSTEPGQAKEFLDAVPLIRALGARTVCGLSNISFGLPNRSLINATFLSMAAYSGLDCAILDPMDKKVMSSASASGAILAKDEYCAGYIKAFREGRLG